MMTLQDIVTVDIPTLGKVSGIIDANKGITRFLGVPYGSLSRRWTRATRIERFPNGQHDGTKFGPICPQLHMPGAPSIIQMACPEFPSDPETVMDEFACLNVNITRLTEGNLKSLPVMCWIHGGAFSVGSNTELVYDGLELVKQSIITGTPVIHVSINYRLGYFGFMASEELRAENGGKAVGNYADENSTGLFDQRLALEFIKTHISAFGGNPDSITIFGESAGGASVFSHCLSEFALFDQAICQSGVTRSLGPLPISSPNLQGVYNSLGRILGHEGKTINLELLRAASAKAIVNAMGELSGGTLTVCFITDDTPYESGFFKRDTDWITTSKFVKRLMIGDCTVEGIITAGSILKIPPKDVAKLLFGPNALPASYLEGLGITPSEILHPTIPGPPLIHRLVGLMTDVAFLVPIEDVISQAPKQSTYIYRFDRPNKWLTASQFAGMAHHTIDLLYLAGIPRKYPTVEEQKDAELSTKMINHWLEFAVGKDPWEVRGEDGWEMVYGADGEAREVKRENISTRDFGRVAKVMGKYTGKLLEVNVAFSTGSVS